MPRNRLSLGPATWAAAAFLLAAVGACNNSTDGGDGTKPRAEASASADPSSSSATVFAAPSATSQPPICAGGWKVPRPGTELATFPLRVIHGMSHHVGSFKVVEMRYFVGVESPPEPDKPYLQDIERWYVKLYDPRDQAFRGRFLVERRPFGSSVVAVAPYDTRGFNSPDWHGLTYESSDTEPKAYPDLPGMWSGATYDFVSGSNGINLPGLPAELAGCLNGT
jgi:hypothetical protein